MPDSRDLFVKSVHGLPVWGASHPIHNFNNAAYKQSFGLGTHHIGGYGGTTFTAVGIHLDGQAIGTSGTALSDVVEAWHLKDIWMPGSEGSRSSIDARGRLLRGIDATGGQADEMAGVLEDRMQGHRHEVMATAGRLVSEIFTGGSTSGQSFTSGTTTVTSKAAVAGNIITDTVNGTPRTGTTTRDKSVTGGVPYMVVMVPV